jgi:hypothetical protein
MSTSADDSAAIACADGSPGLHGLMAESARVPALVARAAIDVAKRSS